MKNLINKLSINQKLAGVTLLLGLVAIFGGNVTKSNKATIDAKEMAIELEKNVGYVKTLELADWIIQGRADFTLVDVQSEKAYQEYNIPGSVNFKITDINNGTLSKTEKIVIYSDDYSRSAKAWFLLRASGYKTVYLLEGGLQSWKNDVLFPKLAANPTPKDIIEFEKIKAISKFFGGQPLLGEQALEANKEAPKMEAPKKVTSAPVASGAKHKKEGC